MNRLLPHFMRTLELLHSGIWQEFLLFLLKHVLVVVKMAIYEITTEFGNYLSSVWLHKWCC